MLYVSKKTSNNDPGWKMNRYPYITVNFSRHPDTWRYPHNYHPTLECFNFWNFWNQFILFKNYLFLLLFLVLVILYGYQYESNAFLQVLCMFLIKEKHRMTSSSCFISKKTSNNDSGGKMNRYPYITGQNISNPFTNYKSNLILSVNKIFSLSFFFVVVMLCTVTF